MVPVSAKNASAADWRSANTWVTMMVRRLSQRSTRTPAIGAMIDVGAWLKKATRPSWNAECESAKVV